MLGPRVMGRAARSDSAALLVIAVCAAHRLDGDLTTSGERLASIARSMSAARRRTTADALPIGSAMSSSDPRPGLTSLRARSDSCTRLRPSSTGIVAGQRSDSIGQSRELQHVKVRRIAEGNRATTCARSSRLTVSTRSAGRTSGWLHRPRQSTCAARQARRRRRSGRPPFGRPEADVRRPAGLLERYAPIG